MDTAFSPLSAICGRAALPIGRTVARNLLLKCYLEHPADPGDALAVTRLDLTEGHERDCSSNIGSLACPHDSAREACQRHERCILMTWRNRLALLHAFVALSPHAHARIKSGATWVRRVSLAQAWRR